VLLPSFLIPSRRFLPPPVLPGSIPYSAVSHPFPLSFKKEGTSFSMVAVQITRVLPNETMQDPAGCMIISLSKVMLLTFDSQLSFFLFLWFTAAVPKPRSM
jgi:hypothetical protein